MVHEMAGALGRQLLEARSRIVVDAADFRRSDHRYESVAAKAHVIQRTARLVELLSRALISIADALGCSSERLRRLTVGAEQRPLEDELARIVAAAKNWEDSSGAQLTVARLRRLRIPIESILSVFHQLDRLLHGPWEEGVRTCVQNEEVDFSWETLDFITSALPLLQSVLERRFGSFNWSVSRLREFYVEHEVDLWSARLCLLFHALDLSSDLVDPSLWRDSDINIAWSQLNLVRWATFKVVALVVERPSTLTPEQIIAVESLLAARSWVAQGAPTMDYCLKNGIQSVFELELMCEADRLLIATHAKACAVAGLPNLGVEKEYRLAVLQSSCSTASTRRSTGKPRGPASARAEDRFAPEWLRHAPLVEKVIHRIAERTVPIACDGDDGPRAPRSLHFEGRETAMEPLPWRLLSLLWTRRTVEISVAVREAWQGAKASKFALKNAIRKVNVALEEVEMPLTVNQANGHLSLSKS